MSQAILRTMKFDTFYGMDPKYDDTVFSFDFKTSGSFRQIFSLDMVCKELIKDLNEGKRVLFDINEAEGKLLAMYAKGFYSRLSTADAYLPLPGDKRDALQKLYEAQPGMAEHPNNPFRENRPLIDS